MTVGVPNRRVLHHGVFLTRAVGGGWVLYMGLLCDAHRRLLTTYRHRHATAGVLCT